MTSVLRRDRREGQTEKGGDYVKTEAEFGVMQK